MSKRSGRIVDFFLPKRYLVRICSLIDKLIVILDKEVHDEDFIMKVFCKAKLKAQLFGSRRCFSQEKVFILKYQWLIDNLSTRFSVHKEKVLPYNILFQVMGQKSI